MLNLGIRITDKCDFTCKHCMFSCTSRGQEMSDKLLSDIAKFIKDYNEKIDKEAITGEGIIKYHELYLKRINSISITGGEPFLNIEKLSSFINSVYSPKVGVSVFTNGSFLLDESKRKYFIDLLNKIKSNESYNNTFINFSSDQFHKEFHTKELAEWLHRVEKLKKHPDKFNEYFNYDTENPFLPRECDMWRQDYCDYVGDATNMLVSFYNSNNSPVNPCGRALENKVYTANNCVRADCPFTHSEDSLRDHFYNKVFLTIDFNGDILVCGSSKSCVVANFYEPNFSIGLIQERLLKLRESKICYSHSSDRLTVCTECKSINLVGGTSNE